MAAKKLSDRTLAILIAIRERCDGTGADSTFWLPGAARGLDDYVCEFGGYVNVCGAGDAAALRGLVRNGLIQHPGGSMKDIRYAFRITEDGIQAIEKAREAGRLEALAEQYRNR